METFKVYVNQVYQGKLYNLVDISHFIAITSPLDNVYITDIADNKVLSTIGNFLDHVPNSKILKELRKLLIPLQMGYEEIKDVKLN